MFWLIFFTILFYLIKIQFGHIVQSAVFESTRAPNADELEEEIFRKYFKEIDRKKQNKISREELPKLLTSLGLYLPEDDLPDLKEMLDPSETGTIEFYPLFKWFKAYNREAKAYEKNGADNDDDDDDDEDGNKSPDESPEKSKKKEN